MAASASHEDLAGNPDNKAIVPLTTWVLISNFKLSYNLLRRPDGTFNRYLAEFMDRRVPANSAPVDGVATMDVVIERATGLWGRLFWSCLDDDIADSGAKPPTVAAAAASSNDDDNHDHHGHGHGHADGVNDQDDVEDVEDTGGCSGGDNENNLEHAKPTAKRPRTRLQQNHHHHHHHQQHQHQNQVQAPPLKPLLVYFHGGSFVHSSANSAIYDASCRRITRLCGAVVLAVNFRRAPEHRFPAAYEDGLTSVRWAQSSIGRQCLTPLRCDPNRCFLAGDSSGGNIAHNVAAAAGIARLPISGTILLMPMFGGEERTDSETLLDGKYFVTMNDRDWYWRAFLPIGATREHPACNPFSASAPSLQKIPLPPSLVVVGGLDLLRDWQLIYVHNMQMAGKSVELMFLEQATMGFFLLPNTDLYNSLVERMKQFLTTTRFSHIN